MQLMPKTAHQYGAKNLDDPLESIVTGVNYLKWLDEYWSKEIPDSVERKKFVLGSYNVGFNHIADARRLTEKYGKDPSIWEDNVAFYLVKKSKSEFFNDKVVKFGYCRGDEPVNYVTDIFERYDHYLKLVEDK
jgi:membrane-bound lytic murein transglycosylase F